MNLQALVEQAFSTTRESKVSKDPWRKEDNGVLGLLPAERYMEVDLTFRQYND